MRSFGTLKWSQWCWKKSSEELRSRSIDWRGQKVLRGRQNCTKWDHVFGPGERSDDDMLLTIKILMILCSGRIWKLVFGVSKWQFIENFMKNQHLTMFTIFQSVENLNNFWFLSKFGFLAFSNFAQNLSFLLQFSGFGCNFVPFLLIFPIFLTSWCMYLIITCTVGPTECRCNGHRKTEETNWLPFFLESKKSEMYKQ